MFDFLKRRNKVTFGSISGDRLTQYNKHRVLGPQKLLCHAPFKSLYFGHHGNVVTCCYNRDYILGQYPKMSIKDIWTGKKAEQLREYIKVNDLSQGCAHCEALLLAGNFDAVKSKQYDFNKFNSNGFPSVMEFELSNTCNLECEMCSGDFSSLIRAKREKLPPLADAYDMQFVDQLEEFLPYLEEIKFYGGEPFLIEIYYAVWERVRKLNPKIRLLVQTNGTTLNNRVKEIIEDTNFHINVSLDSLQKENYERIRKNADFKRVMENIDYFYNYCKNHNTSFGISVCGMQQNWREMPDFVNYCNNLNVPLYIHTVFAPVECALKSLSPEQLLPVIKYLEGFDFPADNQIQIKNRNHYRDFIKQIVLWSKAEEKAPEKERHVSMDELRDRMLQRIEVNVYISDEEKAAKSAAVKSKFKALNKNPDYDVIKSVIANLEVNNYESLDKAIDFFEIYTMEQLLELAQVESAKR